MQCLVWYNIVCGHQHIFCIVYVCVQSLKVLRTSEFLPYVVFLKAPVFQVLKALNHTAVEAGVVTEMLTVGHAHKQDSHTTYTTMPSLCKALTVRNTICIKHRPIQHSNHHSLPTTTSPM